MTDTNANLTMRIHDNATAKRISGTWRMQMADQVKVDVWYDYA